MLSWGLWSGWTNCTPHNRSYSIFQQRATAQKIYSPNTWRYSFAPKTAQVFESWKVSLVEEIKLSNDL